MQISRRAAAIAPSMTLAIDAKAKELKAAGESVIGFGAGEPDFDTPLHIRQAGKDALDKGMTRYTPAAGMPELKKAIAEKLARENGLTYQPSDIVVSCGAKHSLFNVFQCILNEGDEVIVPTPCWVSYPEMVCMAGGVPVFVEGKEDRAFKPAIESLAAAVTPKTRALVLCTPNNPNGHVYNKAELEAIAQLAVAHDFVVISDEIYEHLVYDGERVPSIATLGDEIKKRTVVVNGVSKSYAMTGWRIGYTASCAELAKVMGNYQSHATSAPATMCQVAAMAALNGSIEERDAMREAFDTRRKLLVNGLNAIPGLSCGLPGGAFYVMLNATGVLGKAYEGQTIDSSMAFCEKLLEVQKVAVVPGEAFFAPGTCRLSYATSQQNIEEGLRRIAAFVAQLT